MTTRYAIIQAGKVINIIQADADFATAAGAVPAPSADIGDEWAGSVFAKPAPLPPVVPKSVTRRQARQALLLAGKLADVQPAIDAIADAGQRAMIQIEWDDSLNFERTRPSLIAMGRAIGIDAPALDALFITAAALA